MTPTEWANKVAALFHERPGSERYSEMQFNELAAKMVIGPVNLHYPYSLGIAELWSALDFLVKTGCLVQTYRDQASNYHGAARFRLRKPFED